MTVPGKNTSSGRGSGFTVVETILVVAILAVFSSMVVPTVQRSINEWRVNRFSRAVLAAHQAARFYAITERRHLQVRYDMTEETIRFFQCSRVNDKGECEAWRRYYPMGVVRPVSDSVDLWSVGKKQVDEACMYFKPSGQVFDPVALSDTLPESSEACAGEPLGTGVHVTWKPNPGPPTVDDKSNHCQWNTVYIIGNSGSASLLDYGAYPTSKGPFRNTLERKPPCAR